MPTRRGLDRRQRLDGRQQRRHLGEGFQSGGGQSPADGILVSPAFGETIPQQGSHALETTTGDQLLHGMAAHDQPPRLAIDFAHFRVGDDHAIQPAIHPCLQHLDLPQLLRVRFWFDDIGCQS